MKIRLAVVYGSRTCEHDVSIISALQAAQNANSNEYDIIYVYIAPNGDWYTGEKLADIALYRSFDPRAVVRVLPMGVEGKLRLMQHPDDKLFPIGRLRQIAEADVVMPVMHGMNGEDGTLQGMLELWGIPYTSSGVLGSAIGMDKIAMKRMFRASGLPVLKDECVDRHDWKRNRAGVLSRITASLPFPVYVKPANLGSSIGINRADDVNGLAEAIDVAVSYDRRVLVEQGVKNLMEINCAVLGYAGDAIASTTEMPVRWTEFLSFEEKYLRGAKGGAKGGPSKGMTSLQRQMPAPISPEMTTKIETMAVSAFNALDCRGVSRVDFLVDQDTNDIFIGEINTIPGSLAFYLWEPKGISFSQMIDKMVEYALLANAEKNENVFSYQSRILSSVGGTKGAKGTKGTKLG
ncbi:MAG: D-alanine--D-alanine ligase [Clostridia bacterium]|nr:D-alanine--D-alanine ligase [Clostridia bacterium]